GPVMAAGAGALGVQLGGPAIYHGELHERPRLGEGEPACAAHIQRGMDLVRQGVMLWVAVLIVGGWLLA
ncbi:cobalamin biosynthesis protein, partial [Metapseudomonas otitidis]|uniref:cobalamin biosynthesis protein n=1 Tax=Metapseudomonas otitidis TaxID=319939 RepID=UPI00198117FE